MIPLERWNVADWNDKGTVRSTPAGTQFTAGTIYVEATAGTLLHART